MINSTQPDLHTGSKRVFCVIIKLDMRIFTRVWFWIIAVVVLGIIGAVLYFATQDPKQDIVSSLVKLDTLVQSVEATGTIESDREIRIDFETSGTIAEVYFREGDEVKAGDVILALEGAEELLQLSQAQAGLDAALGNLNLQIAGNSDESLAVTAAQLGEAEALLAKYESDLDNAETDLTNTETTYAAKVATAEANLLSAEDTLANTEVDNGEDLNAAYEDAITVMKGAAITAAGSLTEADKVLGIENTNINDEFDGLLASTNEQALLDAEQSFPTARTALLNVEDLLETITVDSASEEITDAMAKTRDMLDLVTIALNDTRHVLDATPSGSYDLSTSELNTMKSTIDTERTAVNTDLTNLINQEQTIRSTEIAAETAYDSAYHAYEAALSTYNEAVATEQMQVALAEASLETAEAQVAVQSASVNTANANLTYQGAGPRAVDLAALEAAVNEASVALALAEEQYEKTKIVAPFDGQVTNIAYDIGETVSLGEPAVEMLALNEFQIVADVDEADITKIVLDDRTEVTFDALGEEQVFTGGVAKVNPAEKSIDGVVYYEITVYLDEVSPFLRSGMSADITIFTEELEHALIVPSRAVLTENMVKYVRVVEAGEVRQREVEVGIRGDGGETQILNGVKEGEEVVITIREE